MSTLDSLVSDVLLTLYGYGLAQPRAAFLTAPVDSTTLTLALSSVDNFSQGIAELGNELVFVDSVDSEASTVTLSPDGRGYFGTTAVPHATSDRLEFAPVWPKQRVKGAINDAIVGTYPALWKTASTSFTFRPSITTYALPAEAEQVLSVTAASIGPSQEQVQINRFSVNTVAPVGVFATGKTITLEQAPFPGRPVTVTYTAAPSALAGDDALTVSGLRETAALCVKYAATSNLLALMDASRLPVDAGVAGEFDSSHNTVGSAARISAQLYQRYELELGKERDRLRALHKTPIMVRTR